MALASQLSHKLVGSTALPYKTFASPIDTDPHYVAGRNVMINSRSYCTMRPGFSDFLEPVPTTFNHLLRLFSWASWEGQYFVMAVDELPTGQMAVYKFQVGTDSSFVQILLEADDPPHHRFPSGVPYSFTTANDYLFISNPSGCWKWSPTYGLQGWGFLGPAPPTITLGPAGPLSPVNGGYCYVITYVNSKSGHESSPSVPATARTGNFTDESVTIHWLNSNDPQVDMVNIYRTPDNGAADPQEMGFVAQVPVGNLSYVDSTPDASLSAVQFAPQFYQNDPAPPMHSIVEYAGRIWGVVGPRVWYSGQEEISNGVPQECFSGSTLGPTSLDGNFYAYPTQVTALGPLTDGVAVFVPNRIYKIEGDSLDTFRRYTLLGKRGTLTDYTVKVVGSSIIWFDRSEQMWLSDQGEIGKDIRPDLGQANLLTVQACIHVAGEQHWICLLDPDNSFLYVYDLDLGAWNVPWSVSATTIESIDTSPGVTRLAVGWGGTQVMLENPALYVDGTIQYNAYLVTNSFSLAPDANPDFLAALHHVAIESNQYQPIDVAVKVDESPAVVTYNGKPPYYGFNPLTTSTDPPLRRNGNYLIQKDYMGNPDPSSPACRRCAVRLDWGQPNPSRWALYSIDLAMTPVGR